MPDTSLFILIGASRGLGAALAQALMQLGHHLICVAHDDNAKLCAQAAATGVTLDWHQVDLPDAHAAEAWMIKTFVVLPVFVKVTLVSNAGAVEPIGTVGTLRVDTLSPYLQLNLAGPMALIAVLLRGTAPWNAQRRTLAISSGVVRRLIVGWAAYCTGKARLDVFVRTISADGGASVRVMALAPGVTDTDTQRIIRGADFAGVQCFRDLYAHGELVLPQNVAARIATYLVRPDFGATELDDLRNIV